MSSFLDPRSVAPYPRTETHHASDFQPTAILSYSRGFQRKKKFGFLKPFFSKWILQNAKTMQNFLKYFYFFLSRETD